MRPLEIPTLALVLLVGTSGSGKTTFARKHFRPTEVLSSDAFRAMVADDENDQSATAAAFEVLHHLAAKRLERGLLTVVDATNVKTDARAPLVHLAKRAHVIPTAIVLDLPEEVCQARHRERPDRDFEPEVIHLQGQHLKFSHLDREGFKVVHVLRTPQEVDEAVIVRRPLPSDRRHDPGPFDLVGDVHGCRDELEELLGKLGYTDGVPPAGRRALFLGDLVDRGPDTPGVLRRVMGMAARGHALCIPGNHDAKLVKALRGRNVLVAHGLEASLEQLGRESPEFREEVAEFLDGLASHYVLDGGQLCVAHAGLREDLQNRFSSRVRDFCLYGDTTGEVDGLGLPVRRDWAARYRGPAAVVYGHTPVAVPTWVNNTINIDTGCVFGGVLTALRWPEREIVQVPAGRTWAESKRPFLEHPQG